MTSRRDFGRDTGLQARMLLTMFLLGLVYVVLIGVAVNAGAGITRVLVIAALFLAIQLLASDKIALRAMSAREVSVAQEPELHAIIERLCVQADLPKPRVAIADTAMPNAFALGRSRKSATVCVTTGLLALLSAAELEGVLAHELTHVINRDVMVMTIASFFASIAALLVRFGLLFGGGRNRNQQGAFAAVLLVSVAVYAISFLLLRALSRYREFAADRGAAVITGRPSALSSALMKISGTLERIPDRDLRTTTRMNAFFIIPARRSVADEPLRRPPAAGEADRRPEPTRDAAAGCAVNATIIECYTNSRSGVAYLSAAATGLFVGGSGPTAKGNARPLALGAHSVRWPDRPIAFGLITLLVAIPAASVIYALLGLALPGVLTNLRPRTAPPRRPAAVRVDHRIDLIDVFQLILMPVQRPQTRPLKPWSEAQPRRRCSTASPPG